MDSFISVSPLKILEKSSRKGLGKGNLGVLIARAGVGKTACLVHIALDKLFRKERLVHVSLEEGPEKVTAYYNVMVSDLVKALNLEDEAEIRWIIDRNRMILAYLNRSFSMERLERSLTSLVDNLDFAPETLIVDGLDFESADREIIERFKDLAGRCDVEIWFSALSHRHITETNERGIPYPCERFDDLFSLIIRLDPDPTGVFLRLLKDYDAPVAPGMAVRLDPNTFLALD
ncbi:MAG: hypothetical protein JRJ35_13100 [Deltaproteobacteria bacterium]|nr:hypothetical protein [Deltaproteobacteria bacterium]MBW1950981.1 hypothetical protein [Deltaproteobacteria bacterium]MBW2008957.1 hypothetical protein [Deltaproteobacteria bacterium]